MLSLVPVLPLNKDTLELDEPLDGMNRLLCSASQRLSLCNSRSRRTPPPLLTCSSQLVCLLAHAKLQNPILLQISLATARLRLSHMTQSSPALIGS